VVTGTGAKLPRGEVTTHIRNLIVKAGLQGDHRLDQTLLLRGLADALRGPNQLGSFAGDALIKLGLLGTIIGFIMMLAPIAGLDAADHASVKSSMGLMSDGMAVAMYTTLTGLIGSILVQTQYYMLDKATAKLFALATDLTEVFVVSVLERGPDGYVSATIPRERPFDPFSVMLFKALQVVAFLFFIALLAINPETKEGKIDTKAEYIITMSWPDSHPDDIDLYAEDPLGNIVWYHEREAGFMVLDRDDRGGLNNSITVNGQEGVEPDPPGNGQHPRHHRRRIHGQRELLPRHHRQAGAGDGEDREGEPPCRGGRLRHRHPRSHRPGEDGGAIQDRSQRRCARRQSSRQVADSVDPQRPPLFFGQVTSEE
jgi:hypothetical protein